jgi:hypothetical protein
MTTVSETLNSTQEEFMTSWEDAITSIADWYQLKMTGAIEDVGNTLAGELESFDLLQDRFNKTKEIDELYIDDYAKIYELSKLNRDITNSIDETDNIKSK